MVVRRATGTIEHRVFRDIKGYLEPGDVVVLNDTRVIPASLHGRKPSGGRVEIFLVREVGAGGEGIWECLVKPSRGIGPGLRIHIRDGIEGEILDRGERTWRVRFHLPEGWDGLPEEIGEVPLPPYIKRRPEEMDRVRYQTVFARRPGAVAAPTAGLHFTEALLEEIKARGVEVLFVTLHTGPGTFMPLKPEDIRLRRLPEEHYTIEPPIFERIRRAKEEGRRIVAVGTTTTRALESAVRDGFHSPVLRGLTDLFIYPGFEFRVVDALVTNFHLPRSSLIMLVCAFAGYRVTMEAYREAVRERYRFYSYGDSMFII